jgi:hypothetical protein
MKKVIQNLFKSIEQKSKLDLITELLIHDNSTLEALMLFDKVKANFIFEMKKRERQASFECSLINGLENKSFKVNAKDPKFDKPLSELEVNYEIVKPC